MKKPKECHRCDSCSGYWSKKGSLLRHLIVCPNAPTPTPSPFKCQNCFLDCMTVAGLKVHSTETKCSDRLPMVCDICLLETKSASHLMVHMKLVHTLAAKVRFACEHCDSSFSYKQRLKNHISFCQTNKTIENRISQKRGREISCDGCSKKFTRKTDIRKHLRNCLGGKIVFRDDYYVCQVCAFSTESSRTASIHLDEEHGLLPLIKRPDNFFTCQGCELPFFSKMGISNHFKVCEKKSREKKQREENKSIVVCDSCGYKGPKFGMRKHMREIHGTGVSGLRRTRKYFTCNDCGKSFGSRSTLTIHLLNPVEKRNIHLCFTCNKMFSSKSELDSHKRENHTRRQDFTCDDCGFITCYRGTFRRHMNNYHSSAGPVKFRCELCTKEFRKKRNLMEHTKKCLKSREADEREKFQCGICNMIKTCRDTLSVHMEAWHPLEIGAPVLCFACMTNPKELTGKPAGKFDPKKCRLCGKPRCTSQRWKAVKRERKNQLHCPHCDFTTNINRRMKYHKTQHFTSEKICDGCKTAFRYDITLIRHFASGKCI